MVQADAMLGSTRRQPAARLPGDVCDREAALKAKDSTLDAAGSPFDVERSPRYRLATLSRLWTSSSERIYDERHGVSLSEWRIIAIVGTEQPINAGAIADRGLLEKSHISRLVARLIGRSLLRAKIDRDDARKSWLYLTARGRTIFNDIAVISLDRDRQFLAALSAREQAVLDGLLDKLLARAPH